MPQETIRDRLLQARLPALPQVLLKLMSLCQSDDVGMAELTGLIATEPALSSRLLAVANSAAYHHGDAPLNLLQAANTLGTEMIKVLTISESVVQAFGAFGAAGGLDLRHFWKHSLTAAVVARELAQHLAPNHTDDAYLVGLLHDVGRLALLTCAPQACQTHFLSADDSQLCDAEQQTLNISHTEAGAWLVTHWKLAQPMAQAVLHHHADPSRVAELHPLTRIMHLTHQLLEWVPACPTDRPGPDFSVMLDGDVLALILDKAKLQVVQTAKDLGLNITDTDTLPAPIKIRSAPATVTAQDQLAQDVQTRSLLTEMRHQLAQQPSVTMLLTSVRQHASILLGLDDALVLLLCEDQHTLDCVSVAPRHLNLATLSVDLRHHPVLSYSQHHRSVTFSKDDEPGDAELYKLLDCPHVVALPLQGDKQVLGLLLAAVPAEQLVTQRNQTRMLHAFGQHAGAALARHLESVRALDARIASIRREQLVNARQLVHEVNTPIGIIKSYLDIIDQKMGEQQPVGNELSLVSSEVARVGSLVEQFSEGTDVPALVPFDLGDLVTALVKLLQQSRFFPPSISIQCQWPQTSSIVIGSADMVKQILINLIKNARESMPQGGRIVISGGIRVQQAGKPYMSLCVSDSGPGLDASLQALLFQPVQIDKTGKNHGIGLNVVHGLVKKMQGEISYRTSPQGVTFELLLPCPQSLVS